MNEAVRLYIEAQFQTLPETPEVERAKQELLQMSEDKYGELLASPRGARTLGSGASALRRSALEPPLPT